MSVKKILIYVVSFLVIQVVLVSLFYIFIELTGYNLPHNHFTLTIIIPQLVAYLTIFWIVKYRVDGKVIRTNFDNIQLKILLFLFLISFGLFLFATPFFHLETMLKIMKGINVNKSPRLKLETIPLIYDFVGAVVFAPVFEELFYRDFIFRQLHKKYSFIYSALISGVLFGLVHLPDIYNVIPAFLFGIVACIIYKQTQNLLYPIIAHFIGNFIVTVFNNYIREYNSWLLDLGFDLLYWVLPIFGILLVLLGLNMLTQSVTEFVSIKKWWKNTLIH